MPEDESTLGVVEPESAPVPETVESNGGAEKSVADGAQKENSDRAEDETKAGKKRKGERREKAERPVPTPQR